MVILHFSFTVHYSQVLSSTQQSLEIDEIIQRISQHRGVIGLMVFSTDGVVIKSNLEEAATTIWAALVVEAVKKSNEVGKAVGGGGSMKLLRIRSTKYEVMIAPDKDFILVAIHEQFDENPLRDPPASRRD